MECPACGSNELVKALRKNDYDIFDCRACGHGVVWPIPSDEELEALYSKGESLHLENGMSAALERILAEDPKRYLRYYGDRLAMLAPIGDLRERRILDFGCTSGVFVQGLRAYGVAKAEGVDIIAGMVEHGKARGLNLTYDPEHRFLDERRDTFDAICAYTVLEHVPDPARVLETFHRALRADGHVFLAVPSYASLQIRLAKAKSPIVEPPHHLHYFTPTSMRRLLQRAGFEVVVERTLFWGRETDLYLASIGVPFALAPLARYLVFPLKALIERMQLGGVLQVLARKVAPGA